MRGRLAAPLSMPPPSCPSTWGSNGTAPSPHKPPHSAWMGPGHDIPAADNIPAAEGAYSRGHMGAGACRPVASSRTAPTGWARGAASGPGAGAPQRRARRWFPIQSSIRCRSTGASPPVAPLPLVPCSAARLGARHWCEALAKQPCRAAAWHLQISRQSWLLRWHPSGKVSATLQAGCICTERNTNVQPASSCGQ